MSASKLSTPSIRANSIRKLRVLGTSVTHIDELRLAAEQDLGIEIEFTTLDGTKAQRRGALAPDSFDVYDQWIHDLDLVWPTGSLQPIEVARISSWNDLGNLPKTGSLTIGQAAAPGGDPSKKLYVQRNGSLSNVVTDHVSMVPTVHNADSFGVVGAPVEQFDSWAKLLDPEFSGSAILQSDAAIGSLDLLLALGAAQQISVSDLGNLSLSEIDVLTDKFMKYRKLGQFRQFWCDESEAIDAFKTGAQTAGSLWWSGAVKLRAQGVPVQMATPREGYRGWFGGVSISNRVSGPVLDMCYDYINWWLSGLPGAIMARNGAYMTNVEAVRRHLSKDEWDFWYGGESARSDISDPCGTTIFKPGESRGGGAYFERMSRIAVWDAVMHEHNYLVRRWDHVVNS